MKRWRIQLESKEIAFMCEGQRLSDVIARLIQYVRDNPTDTPHVRIERKYYGRKGWTWAYVDSWQYKPEGEIL